MSVKNEKPMACAILLLIVCLALSAWLFFSGKNSLILRKVKKRMQRVKLVMKNLKKRKAV